MKRTVKKIMRPNIFPNQFYAALAIFSTPKRVGGGAEPPQFSFGGYSPPVPPPLLDIRGTRFNARAITGIDSQTGMFIEERIHENFVQCGTSCIRFNK